MRYRTRITRLATGSLATIALAAGVSAVAAAPAHAAPGAQPVATVVHNCAGVKQIQPRDLTSIYCGDMGLYVTNITWIAWTDGGAAGFGTEHRKLCKPNCAAGRTASRPVGVWLFAPVKGAFTEVSLYSSVTAPPETYRLTGYSRR